MQLSPPLDAETVALVHRVCEEAWQEAQCRLSFPDAVDPTGLRNLVAERVRAAVAIGQRNPERLRAIALDALDA